MLTQLVAGVSASIRGEMAIALSMPKTRQLAFAMNLANSQALKGIVDPLVNLAAKKVVSIALSEPQRRIHELGGEQTFTYVEYLHHLSGKKTPCLSIKIPSLVVRIASHLFDLIHFSPLSFGHYELMQRDNLPNSFN